MIQLILCRHIYMFQYLLLTAVLGVAFLAAFALRRYRFYVKYCSILKQHYKVFIHPFDAFGAHKVYKKFIDDVATNQDAHHTVRQVYPDFQIVVGTIIGKPLVEIVDVKLLKEFYQRAHEGCYVKSTQIGFGAEYSPFFGRGLVFSQGEKWKSQRKMLSNVFNHSFIKSKLATICSIAMEKIVKAEKQSQNKQVGKVTLNLLTVIQEIFGTAVVKCFFGDMELSPIEGEQIFLFFNQLFMAVTQRAMSKVGILGQRFFNLGVRKIDRQIKDKKQKFKSYIQRLVDQKILELKQENGALDTDSDNGILKILIREGKLKEETEKVKEERGNYYTYDDFIEEFATFMFAGTDTTSSLTTTIMYIMASQPEIEHKVRQEVADVTGGDMSLLSYENLKRMTYLDCVQKQTLRIYTPVLQGLNRIATKDHMLGQIPIYKGFYVTPVFLSNQVNAQYFTNPDKFLPERWLDPKTGSIDEFSFIPFSWGPRSCIGQQLAFLESKIAIALLLNRYERMELPKPNYDMKYTVLYGPEIMPVIFTKHSN